MDLSVRTKQEQTGFSLIEVLTSVIVVAFGLLAVTALQSRLITQSGENKAQAEAVALAQARIEQVRNYTNRARSRGAFDTLYAATNGYGNSTTVNGVNAVFTRQESIAAAGDTKQVSVRVAWTNQRGVSQSVALATELGWESPRAIGDLARTDAEPLVGAPTGRAHLGEGVRPNGAATVANGDGTEIYDDDSGDLKLIDDGHIVLTLEQACQNDSCIDFVEIAGRVYIDTDTQNNLQPGEVQVIASDASYCKRYYTPTGSEVTVGVTNDTASTISTPGGDYEYFDYRCYLGGGWHGSIGILLDGGLALTDKICQGDPVSMNAWEQPVIAARRAYRGMRYRIDNSTPSGKAENANGDPIYYSIGIADAAKLPDPTEPTDKTHDFVIGHLSTSATEGSNCISQLVMVRPDSNVNGAPGDLFAGVPADFVCLNPGNVDTFDTSIYGVTNVCPYDPTDPPARRHIIQGSITVAADADLAAAVVLITVNTSDGPGNCTTGSFTHGGSAFTASYSCDVYDWGAGWNGYLQVKPNSTDVACDDRGTDGARDQRMYLTSVTGDRTDKDFSCAAGNIVVVTGTVTTSNANKTLRSATINAINGSCAVATDRLSYSCTTGVFDTSSWSGTITFTATSGKVCGTNVNVNTGTATLTNLAPGEHPLDLRIVNNTNCN